MTKRVKKILRNFHLGEISAVTRPAQEHARALIIKRKDSPMSRDEAITQYELELAKYVTRKMEKKGWSRLEAVDAFHKSEEGRALVDAIERPDHAGKVGKHAQREAIEKGVGFSLTSYCEAMAKKGESVDAAMGRLLIEGDPTARQLYFEHHMAKAAAQTGSPNALRDFRIHVGAEVAKSGRSYETCALTVAKAMPSLAAKALLAGHPKIDGFSD
jgi:hypothetical protein